MFMKLGVNVALLSDIWSVRILRHEKMSSIENEKMFSLSLIATPEPFLMVKAMLFDSKSVRESES